MLNRSHLFAAQSHPAAGKISLATPFVLSTLGAMLVFLSTMTPQLTAAIAAWSPDSNYVDADLIRVGISDDAMTSQEYPSTQISATTPFSIRDKSTGKILLNANVGTRLTITVNKAGFYVQNAALPPAAKPQPITGPLLVEPANANGRLKITNITRRKEIPEFRGNFEIVRAASSPNKLSVVNVVSLEDYLKAVVPNELPMRYGLEAVKAQAIAARNYAVRPREKPWKTFDICDSQLCQVYLGAQTETPDSNQAIAATEGLVGIYNGDPILALFSSSHGGYAEDYSNAFSDPITKQYPAPSIPYLTGGPDQPMETPLNLKTETGARQFWSSSAYHSFDVESPYYRWTKQWTRPELENAINQGLIEVSKDNSTKDFVTPHLTTGQTIGALKSINVLERGNSGKIMILAIEGANGTWTVQKEFLIRKLFKQGGKMLPSGNVVFTPQKDPQGHLIGMTAQGGGFGHGVGLSQLGASWMHKHGYKFPQIVQHYYKGISLGSLPIKVGGGNSVEKPVLTRFRVSDTRGVLWVQEGNNASATFHQQAPVEVQINGQSLQLEPSGFRSAFALSQELKPNTLNQLVLNPDRQNPQRTLKVWVDLYPPQSPSFKFTASR